MSTPSLTQPSGATGIARKLAVAGRRALLVPLLATAIAAQAQAGAELGFTTRVSKALIEQLERRYGGAAERLPRWIEFAATQKAAGESARPRAAADEIALLRMVNDFLNLVPYRTDQAHWSQPDYWATPAESVASNGGDCEDYAIAKYYMLKELGVPLERLRITYVKAIKLNEAHMVLAYYARPDAEPLILDNLDGRVRPASERSDLVPVYSFNDDEVTVVAGGQRGRPSQIRAWLSVQERLQAQSRT